MAQADMDGGSGGWQTFFGSVVQQAGNTLANKINNGAATSSQAERMPDQTLTEDIQGQPTPVQKSMVGNIGMDARTLVIGGGVVLTAIALFFMASK